MDFSNFDIHGYRTTSVQQGYSEWVKTYEQTVKDEMDIRLLAGIQTVRWEHTRYAVDLACGTGRIGAWLKGQGIRDIDGVDLTPEMLAKASEKGIYRRLLNEDVTHTSLPAEAYNLVIQSLADEHIADLYSLYREASRLAEPGGYFVIVGYHPQFLMQGIVTHFHREGGEAVAIKSYVHLLSDHVKAAHASDWQLKEMDEGLIDQEWLEKKPKWERYRHRPVSFVMVWLKER